MKFKIAGKSFSYEPKPEWKNMLEAQYSDFLLDEDEPVDFVISEDRVEENRSIMNHRDYQSLPVEIEMGSLQIAIIDLLRPFGNLLIHSAVVTVDGEAYAFTGHSGIGKSTQCQLWLKHFGSRSYILNGDKSFYQRNQEGWTVYGTPWKGKERIGINGNAPLKGIIYLSQEPVNKIEKLSKQEEINRLIKQTYMPRYEKEMDQHLLQIEQFVNEVTAYSLQCTISDEAVTLAYKAINQQ